MANGSGPRQAADRDDPTTFKTPSTRRRVPVILDGKPINAPLPSRRNSDVDRVPIAELATMRSYNTLMFVDNADHDIVAAGYCGRAPNDEDSC